MTNILHISTAHTTQDIRIYLKEVKSLINKGFDVKFLVASNEKNDSPSSHIYIKKSSNRIKRMIFDNYRMYKKIKEINPEIVHFHDPEFLPYSYILMKQKFKVIYDSHEDLPRAILSKPYINIRYRKIMSYLIEKLENYISSKLTFIVTATPHIEKRFKKINKNTICINNYPLMNELLTPTEIKRKDQVCYVGGLSYIRGSKVLSEASLLADVPMVIAGNTKDLGENNLKLLGNINREEVALLLGESKAGIVTFLPEPNHINARPNKMFEYMSASLPVICSNFPEWQKIIEENKCGISVDPENPKELSDAIKNITKNDVLVKKMGENGRNAILNKYNWSIEEEKLFSLYKKLEEI